MKFVLIAAAAALSGLAAAETTPAYDAKALAPILTHSWLETGSCEAPEKISDWVIDIDGTMYERSAGGGYTPLSSFILLDGALTMTDEVGIGKTTTIYQMREDGALRLWSQIFQDEDGNPPEVYVKDGKALTDDDGQPSANPPDTPALKPCPLRASLFPAETVAALDGAWADVKGGSCGKGTGAILFDLTRPVPTLGVGPTGDQGSYDSWILSIEHKDKVWEVTTGDTFEANPNHFAENTDGTLTRTDDYADSKPVTYKRCPR